MLQYEFWDLEVNDSSFSVTLCFDESNERLTVPFEAITNFVDPSSKFGLQFTPIVSQEKNKPQEKPSKKASIDERVSLFQMLSHWILFGRNSLYFYKNSRKVIS